MASNEILAHVVQAEPMTSGTHIFDEIEVCLPQVQVGAGQQASAEYVLDIRGLGLHADLCICLPEQALWQAGRERVAAAFLGAQGSACTSVMALRPGVADSCIGASSADPVAGEQVMPHARLREGPDSPSGMLEEIAAH